MSRSDPAHVLREWTERGLTAAARAGELALAFEVDDHLRRVGDVLAHGRGRLALQGRAPWRGLDPLLEAWRRMRRAERSPRVT